MMISPAPEAALRLVSFLNASPEPFHAVRNAISRLQSAGFTRLSEQDSWTVKKGTIKLGGKYFVTRNQSSIIAFTVPAHLDGAAAMSIVGCHTDSPRFIVKPVSKREKLGYAQVGVETYGGGIWATWLDRDLSFAGKVIISSGTDVKTVLVNHTGSPILRMPTVAIHLNRAQNEKMYYNPESQQVPILALCSKSLNDKVPADLTPSDPLDLNAHHHPIFLHAVASAVSKELGEEVNPSQIHDFELSLYDTQPSTVGGALNEFVFSARLDNLYSTFCALEGMVASSQQPSKRVNMIAMWDHEEIGSVSAHGAESNFIESVIERIAVALKSESESATEAYQRSLASSYLISCDMAHAVHPSFPELHEDNLRPMMNSGPAIKTNSKQRYASTAATTFALRRIAKIAGVPLQEYGVRNDCPCGSTIGPLVSKIGLRTVDIGCPMLSMHSVRETAGSGDVATLIKLFVTFFESFAEVDDLSNN